MTLGAFLQYAAQFNLFSLSRYQGTSFSFLLSFGKLNFQELRKNMERGAEDHCCQGKLVLPHCLKKWIKISGHVSLSPLLSLYFGRSLPEHELIQSRILLKFLFIRLLTTRRVQLVRESFSDLINVPRIGIFYSFTLCS